MTAGPVLALIMPWALIADAVLVRSDGMDHACSAIVLEQAQAKAPR